jgi:hypothetical protein
MTVDQRAKLIRSLSSIKKRQQKDAVQGAEMVNNLVGSAGSLGAGLIAGAIWARYPAADGGSYKIAGLVPWEYVGAGAGLLFGGLWPLGGEGSMAATAIKGVGDGLIALIGAKLGAGFIADPKTSGKKMALAVAGEGDLAGYDPAMGADPSMGDYDTAGDGDLV